MASKHPFNSRTYSNAARGAAFPMIIETTDATYPFGSACKSGMETSARFETLRLTYRRKIAA